ncbi:hypothetical protein MRX96_019037 [Rhipicephalus microplus]
MHSASCLPASGRPAQIERVSARQLVNITARWPSVRTRGLLCTRTRLVSASPKAFLHCGLGRADKFRHPQLESDLDDTRNAVSGLNLCRHRVMYEQRKTNVLRSFVVVLA